MPNTPPQMWAMDSSAKLQSQHQTAQSRSANLQKVFTGWSISSAVNSLAWHM